MSLLQNIENIYRGLKTLLETKGLSVQSQNRYPLRTAIDQRGEQILNKDAKFYSGIKNFANNESSVLKWTLNQAPKNYLILPDYEKNKQCINHYDHLKY